MRREMRARESRYHRCWFCPLTYGRGLSPLVLEDPIEELMNDDGREDGRLGSCTGGGRSIGHSVLGLCMLCMFAGIRG